MDASYPFAQISHRAETEIKRLESQLRRDTGKSILLVAYEDAVPAPAFDDRRQGGGAEFKAKAFQDGQNLYGSITQRHV